MIKPIIILFILTFFLINCKSTDSSNTDPQFLENQRLLSILEDWYLWNDQIDDDVNPADFESQQELIDQLKNSTLDRWSNISDAIAFTTYYDEGTYLGYGFSYDWDSENNIRIRYTFDDSPFGDAGIQRGWKLLKIDNVDVQTITDWSNIFGDNELGYTQSFLIEDSEGNKKEHQISKDIVKINAVLYSDTLSVGTETVGHLVFNNFINPAIAELDKAFDLFQRANINWLILDLRYNGGGQISVANYLANYLVQTDDNGSDLYKLLHNNDRSSNNESYSLSKKGTLDIKELIVLTTDETASASELILNGLKPLIMLTHIGEGNTYGKPVGSYSWLSLDKTEIYSLISFRFLNSNDEGGFFDGIEPDYSACDNLSKPFGSSDEDLFAAAIEYIKTGTAPDCDIISKSLFKRNLPQEGHGPALIVNQ